MNTELPSRFGYPWAPSTGLSLVLWDPVLWAQTFSRNPIRKAYKKAFKKGLSLRAGKPLSIDDDQAFGAAFCATVAMPHGRTLLRKAQRRESSILGDADFDRYLANALCRYAMVSVECLPPFPDVCVQRGSAWFMDLPRFVTWLSNQHLQQEALRPLAVYTAAFAILQPEIAGELGQSLCLRERAFWPLVESHPDSRALDEDDAAEPTEVDLAPATDEVLPMEAAPAMNNRAQVTTGPEEDSATTLPDPGFAGAASARPDPDDAMLNAPRQPTTSDAPANRDHDLGANAATDLEALTPTQLRDRVEQLRRLAEEAQAHLAQLSTDEQRAAELASHLAHGPWFSSSIHPHTLLNPSGEGTIRDLRHQWSLQLAALERACQAQDRATELTARLGRAPRPFLTVEVGIDGIAKDLETRAELLAKQLEAKEERRARVRTFGSRVRANQLAPADFFAALDPAPLVDLLVDPSCGAPHLTGLESALPLLFALLLARDPDSALSWLETQCNLGEASAANLCAVLAVLDDEMWSTLAPAGRATSGVVAAWLAGRAIRLRDGTRLEYLPLVLDTASAHPLCRTYYDELLTAHRRGTLDFDAIHAPPKASVVATEPNDRKVVNDWILNLPGMNKTYHRLRVVAQQKYLLPLRAFVDSGDRLNALAHWQTYGGLEQMVEACVADGRFRHGVTKHHREKTVEYLSDFSAAFRKWADATHTDRRQPNVDSSSLTELLSTPTGLRSTDWYVLTHMITRALSPDIQIRGVGLKMTVEGVGATPMHPWSWRELATQDHVHLTTHVFDYLRTASGCGPTGLRAAVDELLAWGCLPEAMLAAATDPNVDEEVRRHLEGQRAAFRAVHAGPLARGAEAQGHDENIANCMLEIDQSVQACRFDDALVWLDALDQAVARLLLRSDPERKALVDFLRAAGEAVGEEESVAALNPRVVEVKHRQAERRYHIRELETWLTLTDLPHELRQILASTVTRLDHPGSWPDEERSTDVADALGSILRWFRARWDERQDEGDLARQCVEALQGWLPRAIIAATAHGQTPVGPTLGDIATAISTNRTDRSVLRQIGLLTPTSISSVQPHFDRQLQSDSSPAPITVQVQESSPDVTTQLRLDLRNALQHESHNGDYSDETRLRGMFNREEWGPARIAASLLLHKKGLSDGEPSFDLREVAYCWVVALTSTAEASDRRWLAWRRACLVSISLMPDGRSLVREDDEARSIAAATIIAAADLTLDPTSEGLREALERIGTSDYHLQRFVELFATANLLSAREQPGSAILALRLWLLLTPRKQADARARLLGALFRARRLEALRRLAAEHSDFEKTLVFLIHAYHRAETDPEVRARTIQPLHALRQQLRFTSLKPWISFFTSLETPNLASQAAVECELVTDQVEETDDGVLLIELRVRPSIADQPEAIQIEIAGASTLTLAEEHMVDTSEVVMEVSRSAMGAPAGDVEIPYRITGQTIRGVQIDMRGSWFVHTARVQRAVPLSTDELVEAWPGSSGDPVRETAFHGREDETRRIAAFLRASDRQRSVMVVGQRRIGKTSVLWRLLEQFPPAPNRAVAAFVDISGLRPSAEGSLPGALFERIVFFLDTHERNEPLRAALRTERGENVEIAKLARQLRPDRSLYAALTGLAQKLREVSNGRVQRLALLLDEFDRFVEPLTGPRREDVKALMWEVRQVVQQATTVSLVLAGSGLLRCFTDDVEEALFGSIDIVRLDCFRQERDRAAILDTFVPERIRAKVCDSSNIDETTQLACHLSGGHPYFLAMLGYATATSLHGRRITPHSVSRAVEQMVRGNIEAQRGSIVASKFYGHTFQTIRECMDPVTEAIAKVLLASLGQRTTARYPSLTRDELIDTPELFALGVPRDRTSSVIEALDREEVLAIDHPPGGAPAVRIRVPMTQAALGHDAIRLRSEGVQELKARPSEIT